MKDYKNSIALSKLDKIYIMYYANQHIRAPSFQETHITPLNSHGDELDEDELTSS